MIGSVTLTCAECHETFSVQSYEATLLMRPYTESEGHILAQCPNSHQVDQRVNARGISALRGIGVLEVIDRRPISEEEVALLIQELEWI